MRFILTKELGRLAKWLRILGFDAEYFTENKESTLIIKALQEDRVILTRNAHLGQHVGIKRLNIRFDDVHQQLRQAIEELALKPDAALMFNRCTICNEELLKADKENIKDKVPEYVLNTSEEFMSCPRCRRTYWRGSHWGNVNAILKEISSLLRYRVIAL